MIEIIDGTNVKTLLGQIRGIIYPIKDNLRTKDDDICIKTLDIMLRFAKKSDKIAEAFVPYFPILLPSIDLLRHKHTLPRYRRPQSVKSKEFVKLADLPKKINMQEIINNLLEYFEKHGGLYAFVTIKKLIPRYESALFC